jgi:hypothetical protein
MKNNFSKYNNMLKNLRALFDRRMDLLATQFCFKGSLMQC